MPSTTHSFIEDKAIPQSDAIFNTAQTVTNNVIEDNGTPVQIPTQPVESDLDSLTGVQETLKAPSSSIFDFNGDNVVPAPAQETASASSPFGKVEAQNDPLLSSEEDFYAKINQPAIFRANKLQSASENMTMPSATATINAHPAYEVVNDMSEFFTDLAD